MPSLSKPRNLLVIGWREWLALPELGIPRIKAKVDTGARTSALHAFDIEHFAENGAAMVRFKIHPVQRDVHTTIEVTAPLIDEREVRSSSGKTSLRPVIRSMAELGSTAWPIEITLVRRDLMGFRMLLGRQAVRRRFLVDPGASFLGGREIAKKDS